MAEFRTRNVADWIADRFRTLAGLNGRHVKPEMKDVVREQAHQPRQTLANELTEMNQELRSRVGELSDSTKYISEDRDNRG